MTDEQKKACDEIVDMHEKIVMMGFREAQLRQRLQRLVADDNNAKEIINYMQKRRLS